MASNDANGDEKAVREIPAWAERYAANRTLPVVVNLLAMLIGFAGISGLSYATAWLWVKSGPAAALIGGIPLLAVCGFWAWFSLGGAARILPPLTRRLYGDEGEAASESPTGAPKLAWAAALLLAVGVLAEVGLGLAGILPMEYMQPASALFLVPALALILSSPGARATRSPFMLLWPGLYAIHAGLVVAGAPIQFGGALSVLNMLIPVVGYGLIAAMAGHIYSRYALRRLKEAAAVGEGDADE